MNILGNGFLVLVRCQKRGGGVGSAERTDNGRSVINAVRVSAK